MTRRVAQSTCARSVSGMNMLCTSDRAAACIPLQTRPSGSHAEYEPQTFSSIPSDSSDGCFGSTPGPDPRAPSEGVQDTGPGVRHRWPLCVNMDSAAAWHGSQIYGGVECIANSSERFSSSTLNSPRPGNKISVAIHHDRRETQHMITHA